MRAKSGKKNSILDKMHDHFLHIAPRYRQLRTTDLGPILFITNKLQELPKVYAADLGCEQEDTASNLFSISGKNAIFSVLTTTERCEDI